MKKTLTLILMLLTISMLEAKEHTLNDMVSLYVNNNRQIKALKNQQQAKEFLIKKSEGLKYPSLDADLSYNILNTEPKIKTPQGNLPANEDKYFKGQLLLSYIIYDFGQRNSIISQALIDKNLTELYLKKEINDQVFNIGKIFYQTISLIKIKETYEEELKSLLEHKKRIDAFYEEGLVTRNEVLQINVEINNTRQKIIKTENDIANLKETLKLMTGIDDDFTLIDTIVLDENLAFEKFNPEDRAEVLIAKNFATLKEEQLKEIDSAYYPKFYARTGINYEQNKYRVDDYYYFLSVGIKMNLFSGMSTTNEKKALLKEIDEQKEKLNLAKDIVKTDYIQAINDYKTSKQKVNVSKEAIIQAMENLKILQGKYEEHLIPATDLIDATLLLTRANTNYIISLYENKIAFLKILWAKGSIFSIFGGNK